MRRLITCFHCQEEFFVSTQFGNNQAARFCQREACQRARKRIAARRRRRRAWEMSMAGRGQKPRDGWQELRPSETPDGKTGAGELPSWPGRPCQNPGCFNLICDTGNKRCQQCGERIAGEDVRSEARL